jgi:hypothetical protein
MTALLQSQLPTACLTTALRCDLEFCLFTIYKTSNNLRLNVVDILIDSIFFVEFYF